MAARREEGRTPRGDPLSSSSIITNRRSPVRRRPGPVWRGQKCFYVAPDGGFHYCAHVPPAGDFASVTAADLALGAPRKGARRTVASTAWCTRRSPIRAWARCSPRRSVPASAAVVRDDLLRRLPFSVVARRRAWVAWKVREVREVRIEDKPAIEGVVPSEIDRRRDHQLRGGVGEPPESRQSQTPAVCKADAPAWTTTKRPNAGTAGAPRARERPLLVDGEVAQ